MIVRLSRLRPAQSVLALSHPRRCGCFRGFRMAAGDVEVSTDAVWSIVVRMAEGNAEVSIDLPSSPSHSKLMRDGLACDEFKARQPYTSQKGRIVEVVSPNPRGKLRSPSPRPRHRDDYKGRDYRRWSRSPVRGRYAEGDYRHRHRSISINPDQYRGRGRSRRSRSRSEGSGSPARCSPSPQKSASHQKSPYRDESPPGRISVKHSLSQSVSPCPRGRESYSKSLSPNISE